MYLNAIWKHFYSVMLSCLLLVRNHFSWTLLVRISWLKLVVDMIDLMVALGLFFYSFIFVFWSQRRQWLLCRPTLLPFHQILRSLHLQINIWQKPITRGSDCGLVSLMLVQGFLGLMQCSLWFTRLNSTCPESAVLNYQVIGSLSYTNWIRYILLQEICIENKSYGLTQLSKAYCFH